MKTLSRLGLVLGLWCASQSTIAARLAANPKAQRRDVIVGARLAATAIGPWPGSTPYWEVWAAHGDRLLRIHVYGAAFDASAEKTLRSIETFTPRGSVEASALVEGNGDALRAKGPAVNEIQERMTRRGARRAVARAPTLATAAGEFEIAEGCWRADDGFFVQTQHGMYANARWGADYTGWTIIGRPNFWDQYSHGRLGYGRCTEPYNTNDKFAIDYPLDVGDVVFSPFDGGTVTFAGRNFTHADYGILVAIEADNGKYVSISGHLSALAWGIYPGARVDADTIIGYAGATGGGVIAVGESHLHQAFYRYPSYNPDGSPYGGAGLQVVRHHFVGHAGRPPGVYTFGWASDATTWSQGNWISN